MVEDNLFVCMEYKEGHYINGSVISVNDSEEDFGISSEEISNMEEMFTQLDDYEGEICNIINVKKFDSEDFEFAQYLIRYLVNGTGSFRHIDAQYSAIKSMEDIGFLEMKLAEELKVDSVVITDFELVSVFLEIEE